MAVTHDVVEVAIKFGKTNLNDNDNIESDPASFADQMNAALAAQNSGSGDWKIATILPSDRKIGSQVKYYYIFFEKTV